MIYFCSPLGCFSLRIVSSERQKRWRRELHTAANSGLSKPLVLSIWLDCKNVSLFFNQWKLNYPDSWGTLEYINIFWQAWLHSPPWLATDPQPPHPQVFIFFLSFCSTLFLMLFLTISFWALSSEFCFSRDSNQSFFRGSLQLRHDSFWEKIRPDKLNTLLSAGRKEKYTWSKMR